MSSDDIYIYDNRTTRCILSDIDDCVKTLNFGPVPGLVVEMKIKIERLEARISDADDIKDASKILEKIKKEVEKLELKKKTY